MTKSMTNHRHLLDTLRIQDKAIVGGDLCQSLSGESFKVIDPSTGKAHVDITHCGPEDIDLAVKSARRAFEAGAWSRISATERKTTLMRLASLMREHAEELALLETLCVGKPINDARSVDIPASCNTLAWFAEAADKVYGEVAPSDDNSLGFVEHEPLGVVGAVVPWNLPLLMTIWKIGPALATGNSVILKPAEQSPLSALRLGQLALEAGIPEGVLNVVPGYGETVGKALGLHPGVDAIGFTGSAEVGKLFLTYSGQSNMKRIWPECGGKSPHIVTRNCKDLKKAAAAVATGIFFNQGQVCNAGSRLLVDRQIKQEFLALVREASSDLIPDDPFLTTTKLGAIVSRPQMERVLSYIETGRNEGADLVMGGKQVRQDSGGYFVEPTIFDNVTNNMTIARDEIFGPVLATISFDTLDEAIAIANDSIYGLGAGIWTDDLDEALTASKRLHAGTVWINNFDDANVTVPFGGFKQSGFGRDKSLHALSKYTDFKTTWIAK